MASKNGKCATCGHQKKLHGVFCWTCVNDKRDPIKRAYQVLKMNGKRRGKWNGLTLSAFTIEAVKGGYIENKGRGANDLTIDCIINGLGYRDGNITVMVKSLNSSKGAGTLNPADLQGIHYSNLPAPF